MTLDLTRLGWHSYFESAFKPYKERGYAPARVAREDRGAYLLFCEQGELSAQVSGRMLHQATLRSDLPAVGDWVAMRPRLDEGTATIDACLPRRSRFSRKVAGPTTQEQIIATAAKDSWKGSRFDVKPACMAGVSMSLPNFGARCGRMKV